MKPSRNITRLIEIMATLRTPESGCPWDLKQSFKTIVPYTIEEAYEVADAVERDDMIDLAEELGDLLLQVIFYARIAEETGLFDFGDIVEQITAKMIRRHPHIFSENGQAEKTNMTDEEVKEIWNDIKEKEKRDKRKRKAKIGEAFSGAITDDGYLAAISTARPAFSRAIQLQDKVKTIGFDWQDPMEVIDKIREETDEVSAELTHDNIDPHRVEDEIGDLLFSVANLARHMHVDPDIALRRTNEKFTRRFQYIENQLSVRGLSLECASLSEMKKLWEEAKTL